MDAVNIDLYHFTHAVVSVVCPPLSQLKEDWANRARLIGMSLNVNKDKEGSVFEGELMTL